MFREMRGKNKVISPEESKLLLEDARYGMLAVNGDGGYPYAVPVNYLYDAENNKIYFHGANSGHKADSLRNNDKICFTIVGSEEIREEIWAPYVKSVVVFGKCHMIEDSKETVRLCKMFAARYYPSDELIEKEISKAGSRLHLYAIDVEHISGKMIQEK